MKKNFSIIVFLFALVLLQSTAFSQLTGVKTIPGTYASINAAVTDLNAQGVGAGGVIFNVAAGHTEIIPAGGIAINITVNFPTISNTVIFQKSGAGNNPVLNSDVAGSGLVAGSLGSNGDAFIKIVGTDYITFAQINIVENYTGAVSAPRMEYGFLLVRGSSTDGCKNVSFSGCVINMQRINLVSSGIASLNINAAGTVTSPTTTDGRNENISVQACTINNSFNGMYFQGFAATTPFDLYDHNYNIGTTTGNTLTNIGSNTSVNTSTQYGIYAIYLDSLRINNNTINVNTGLNTATHYGIFTSTGTNSSVDIINNTVSDTTDNTVVGASQQAAIYNSFGSSGTDNRVNINNNTVRWCRYFHASSPTVYYIANVGSALTVNMNNNTVDSNTIGGQAFSTATGSVYGIYNSATNTNVAAVHTISGNIVRNLTRTQSAAGTGINYGIYNLGSGYNTYIHTNQVYHLYNGTTTSALAGIYSAASLTGSSNIYNNIVRDLRKTTGATTGPLYGIYNSQSSLFNNVYNNQIYNLNNLSATATGVIYGYYNFGSPASGLENVHSNIVRDITHQGTTVSTNLFFVGIYCGTGVSPGYDKIIRDNQIYNVTTNYGQTGGILVNYADTAYIYNNQISNITNTTGVGNTPQVYGLFMNNTVLTSVYFAYNNNISGLYANSNPTFPGILGIWQNGGNYGGYYYNSVYLDAVSTGVNFGSIALYIPGATTTTDLRNNIAVNKSTPMGTGGSAVLYRGEGVLTYYSALSNNNNFYTTGGANTFVYLDPVNTAITINDFKTLVTPRDNASFSENSPFLNTSSQPYNLHMSTTIPTLTNNGGTPVTTPIAVTTDIDGNTRNVTTPDVGSDEFAGVGFTAPTLISPANNSINQSQTPLMDWSDVATALSYRLQISKLNDFSTTVLDSSGIPASQFTVPSGLLGADTIYYWRVYSTHVTGNGPYSAVWNFRTAPLIITLNLTMIPGGFYNTGTGRLNMRDSVRAYLVDSATCVRVDSAKGMLDSVNFTASLTFNNAETGNYYLIVFHRNHIPVATRLKVGFTRGSVTNYNLTTALNQAFGNNMIQVSASPLRFGLIPGDANRDQFVDGLDQTIWIGQNGLDGYRAADFNGDSFVDGLDQTLWITHNGASSFLPCAIGLTPNETAIDIDGFKYVAPESREPRKGIKNND